ncbi:MAG: zf-HC2 domain-containing protein [Thermodesulfovibrionales bacterium]
MKMDHHEIRELLPDYLHGNTSAELTGLIQAHLDECRGCSEELRAISGISQLNVPDPGDLYWKTLPQRVRATVEEETRDRLPFYSAFLRPLTAVVAAVVIITFVYIFTSGKETMFFDPTYDDPFTEVYIDYTELNDIAIPSISIELADNDLFMNGDMYGEYSFHYELTSLSSDELDILGKQLNEIQKIGG